jgi:tetratricopeptide (TPR) repeat protein
MGPLPYPHRVTFLASTLIVPAEHAALAPYLARLVSTLVFDHLVRHPVVTLGDQDDERLTDETSQLLDAQHPQVEDSIDWLFRVARRHEVLWFELSFDRARPAPPILRSRRPDGPVDAWRASAEPGLSQQLGHCLAQWLGARRLPAVAALPSFTLDDMRGVAERLAAAERALVLRREHRGPLASLLAPPARLPIAFLRVLSELSRDDARALDPLILKLDPTHPVARRNRYVAELVGGSTERRAILPLLKDAPMYGKPHLSVWGDAFAADRPLEGMGVRHQGIAASLSPANPYACHNYSLQLAEDDRREESYRWADRATVAAPELGAAHLDCVRRLRQVGRPGQAFAEAQYRCREILDRAAAGSLSANDVHAPHHAALLIAWVHFDVGRLAEAIDLADSVLAQVPGDAATREALAATTQRIAPWKTDPAVFARSYAWEGHHRGDPGRVLAGLSRAGVSDDKDAMMLLDALCAIGRADQAEIAYWQLAGTGALGDGKARLIGARALILAGELDEALDQIQIVQLRRSQSRFEAEINRLLRLAVIWPVRDWERVVERRLARGARTLAQLAARDLSDFVPGLDTPVMRRALGDRRRLAVDPGLLGELIAAVPAAHGSAQAIVERLAPPAATLAAADALAQDWWTALVPSARDRDAHAAGAVLALGLALAHYLVAASGPATPVAGAYRHIATEALHLVRRSRYQIEPPAVVALLRLIDGLGATPDWLLDPWLLRIERALDLEAEHGTYLDGMVGDLPNVSRLLRGDERIGWELRLAHDLASDPSQYEAAATLFARSARAVEAGGVWRAWSAAAAHAPSPVQLDVQATAALANPTGIAAPWLRLAHALLRAGRRGDGFVAACHAMVEIGDADRGRAVAELATAWAAAGVATPLDGATAFERGLAAAAADQLDAAVDHLRWAAAVEPNNPQRVHRLAAVLARHGAVGEAVRVLSRLERTEAPRAIGRVLAETGRASDAVRVLRYAARRFRSAADWALLASAAHRAGDDAVAVDAGRRAIALGVTAPALRVALATSLYRMGAFVECEQLAHALIAEAGDRTTQLAALHAMARALAGQGRHLDAHRYAKAAAELVPEGELAAELADTMAHIAAQDPPAFRVSAELSMERQALDELEAGQLEALTAAIGSPSWGIAGVALAACEFRTGDDSGVPVAPRALEAALVILGRTVGASHPEAVLARIRALRIRDNAFIQIDPPPPLGARYAADQLERIYVERSRRPSEPPPSDRAEVSIRITSAAR